MEEHRHCLEDFNVRIGNIRCSVPVSMHVLIDHLAFVMSTVVVCHVTQRNLLRVYTRV